MARGARVASGHVRFATPLIPPENAALCLPPGTVRRPKASAPTGGWPKANSGNDHLEILVLTLQATSLAPIRLCHRPPSLANSLYLTFLRTPGLRCHARRQTIRQTEIARLSPSPSENRSEGACCRRPSAQIAGRSTPDRPQPRRG